MAQEDYYARFEALQQGAQNLTQELTAMKADIAQIIEENAKLKIENEHLRRHLAALNEKNTSDLPESRRTLEKLYQEGFHVCTVMYGAHRESQEECAFCLDVIYGDRKNK